MSGSAELTPMGEAVRNVYLIMSMFFLWMIDVVNGPTKQSGH